MDNIEAIRQLDAKGKILVENNNGGFDVWDKGVADHLPDLQYEKRELKQYFPDENNVARPCPTGLYVLDKKK
jgi:hypothetical protein